MPCRLPIRSVGRHQPFCCWVVGRFACLYLVLPCSHAEDCMGSQVLIFFYYLSMCGIWYCTLSAFHLSGVDFSANHILFFFFFYTQFEGLFSASQVFRGCGAKKQSVSRFLRGNVSFIVLMEIIPYLPVMLALLIFVSV